VGLYEENYNELYYNKFLIKGKKEKGIRLIRNYNSKKKEKKEKEKRKVWKYL